MPVNDDFKLKKSFFHTYGRAHTEDNQNLFESLYKSGHSVRSSEVWAETVDFAELSTDADALAVNPSASSVTKYTQVSLTEIPGSNEEAWKLEINDEWIKPWISPTDVPHSTTGEPSNGFTALLYDSTKGSIGGGSGEWVVDYTAGIVMFQNGSTPSDLGYGTPRITCYVYTGNMLDVVLAEGGGGTGTDGVDGLNASDVEHNNLEGLQGGNASDDEFYHLDSEQIEKLENSIILDVDADNRLIKTVYEDPSSGVDGNLEQTEIIIDDANNLILPANIILKSGWKIIFNG